MLAYLPVQRKGDEISHIHNIYNKRSSSRYIELWGLICMGFNACSNSIFCS